MPIYERRCAKCQFQDDRIEPIEADGASYTVCPNCASKGNFKRIMSRSANMAKSWEESCRGKY